MHPILATPHHGVLVLANGVGPSLASVYDEIGSQVGTERETRELTVLFTVAGAALLTLGGLLSALWLNRIP